MLQIAFDSVAFNPCVHAIARRHRKVVKFLPDIFAHQFNEVHGRHVKSGDHLPAVSTRCGEANMFGLKQNNIKPRFGAGHCR